MVKPHPQVRTYKVADTIHHAFTTRKIYGLMSQVFRFYHFTVGVGIKSLQTAAPEKRAEYFSSLEFEFPACTSTMTLGIMNMDITNYLIWQK